MANLTSEQALNVCFILLAGKPVTREAVTKAAALVSKLDETLNPETFAQQVLSKVALEV